MEAYQKAVKEALTSLINKLIDGKLQNKRAINAELQKLQKALEVPLAEFKKELARLALDAATKKSAATMKLLMDIAGVNTIQSVTTREIAHIVDMLFKEETLFTKYTDGKLITEAVDIEKAINGLPKATVEDVRKALLGGYIDGSHPTEIASNIIGNVRQKTLRRQLKTIISTVQHRAMMTTNLEILKKNEKYFDMYEYQTASDEKVDHICKPLDGKTWKKFVNIPESEKPPRHYNCRCDIVPSVGNTSVERMIRKKKMQKIDRLHKAWKGKAN